MLNAERKQIDVQVNCPEHLLIPHDRKWTSEALFNILDNAVKYTLEKGNISVAVECWEMYLKISISDNGKGIPEKHHGTIFKQFYREDDVDNELGRSLFPDGSLDPDGYAHFHLQQDSEARDGTASGSVCRKKRGKEKERKRERQLWDRGHVPGDVFWHDHWNLHQKGGAYRQEAGL